MKKTRLAAALALAMGVASGAAFADQDRGGFMAFDLGPTSNYAPSGSSPMSFRIGGGSNFADVAHGNVIFGWEANYASFGTSSFLGSSIRVWGIMGAGTVAWKIPNTEGLKLIGNVGMMRATATYNNIGGFPGNPSQSSTSTFYGIGVKYEFDKNWAVRGQYTDYGSTVSGLNTLTAGVVYAF